MDWKECAEKRMIKKVTIDHDLITALIKSSENRLATASRITIDQVSASTVVSLYYDCLRELLEALGLKNGYKIYNHDCFCALLKEILHEESIGDLFDRFRKIRNGINYYGTEIDANSANEIKDNISKLIRDIRRMI